MRLYSDALVDLYYYAEKGILYAAWREHKPYCADDVKKAFMAVVGSAREHQIKHILLNFADNTQNLTEKEYKTVLAQLTVGLLPTTIQKVACIGSNENVREKRIMRSFDKIKASLNMPLQFRFFNNRAEALQWLLEV